MTYRISTAILVSALVCAGEASAALHDRGGGLLFDDVLKVTWLQDANYAKTSGYDADGRMTHDAAFTWAENLVFHDSVRNVDYSDWRLANNAPVSRNPPNATNAPVDGEWRYYYSTRGEADSGYNITSPNSELSYMYYVNLGLKGYFSFDGTYQPDYGIFGNGKTGGQNNVGLVQNLQSFGYWSRSHSGLHWQYAFYFSNSKGLQDVFTTYSDLAAWAVRPGDVAAVPEPETYAMLLAGLGIIGAATRRRK
jgi:hypothetical protein